MHCQKYSTECPHKFVLFHSINCSEVCAVKCFYILSQNIHNITTDFATVTNNNNLLLQHSKLYVIHLAYFMIVSKKKNVFNCSNRLLDVIMCDKNG